MTRPETTVRATGRTAKRPSMRDGVAGPGGRPAAGAATRPADDSEPPIATPAAVAAVISVAFLLAGLAWPRTAETLLNGLILTLAAGLAIVLAYRTLEAVREPDGGYSPFAEPATDRAPPVAPQELRRLTSLLDAADDRRSAARTRIPLPVLLTIRSEAERRLAAGYGLDLDDPNHRERARSLVSDATWRVLRPGDHGPADRHRPKDRHRPVPLSEFGRILDDLEAL